jgi:hypothetical protein
LKWSALVISCVIPSFVYAADWQSLSKVNDPPGMPSVRAALVATQGMTKAQIAAKRAHLAAVLKKGRSTAYGEQVAILTREVNLLTVALEAK